MTFHDLGLSAELLRAIDELGYTSPTPIQEKAIPYVQMGRDVIGVAQTGTGKTASFTLPMMDILSGGRAKARMPRSLILSPTRELAAQIAENFDKFGKYISLSKVLLIGGESMEEQIKQMDRGCDVLIATPGRLLDLFERGRILLTDIKVFVIDEADRMMDMGFIPDIEKIASKLPPLRQTLLFSATMEPAIKRLAEKFLSNPKEVSVAPPATVTTTVAQHLVKTHDRQKRELMRHLLKKDSVTNAMIFCNRKRDIDVLVQSLKRHGFNAEGLHGDMVQSKRTETLDKFRVNDIHLLVCSDVAARGLDIKGVSHVFNFDVPFNAEDYVHRIGRTGRAGATGIAYTFATNGDDELVQNIEKLTGKPIPVLALADFTPTAPTQTAGREHNRKNVQGGDAKNRTRGGRNRKSGQKDKPAAPVTAPVVTAITTPTPVAEPTVAKAPAKPAARAPIQATYDHSEAKSSARDQQGDDSRDAADGPMGAGFGDDLPAFMKISRR